MKNLFLLFAFLFLITNPSFSQSTIYVPADYPTIQDGIDAASDGDIVLVADGTYYENINYKGKAITVASHFLIDGDTSHISNTIIDGSQPSHPDTGSVVIFNSSEDSTSVLCGFTLTGGTGTKSGAFRDGGAIWLSYSAPTLKNNIIEYNQVISEDWVSGGAIYAFPPIYSHLIIEDNIIRNNWIETTANGSKCVGIVYVGIISTGVVTIRNNEIYDNQVTGPYDSFGGGLMIYSNNNSTVTIYIENNKIFNNQVMDTPGSSTQWGGGIYLESVNAVVRNNIIVFNSAENGGGIYYYNNLTPPLVTPIIVNNTIYGNTATGSGGALNTNRPYDILNCIVWGNSSPQFYGGSASIDYSNIEENYTGTGNISQLPEIMDTTYFVLSGTSPCIDMGNPDVLYNDIEDPNNLGFALYPAQGTLINDIGHFGGPNSNWSELIVTSVEGDESDNLAPEGFILSQNYPNPFNPTTTIKYGVKERSFVELRVYDILGREVVSLFNEEQDAGYYEVNFDAAKLSSGVYLYKLKAGEFIETRKMLLLK